MGNAQELPSPTMTVKPTGFTQPGIEGKPGFGKAPTAPMPGSVGKFPAPCSQRGVGRRLRDAAGCCTVQDLLLQGGSAAPLCWGWRLGWVPPGWKSGRERYESLLSSICKSVLFKPLLMQGKTAF